MEEGSISVVAQLPDSSELVIAELAAGEFLGEMSIFEREPRSATCRASGSTKLLSMHESDLFSFVSENPAGATKLMRQMLAVTRQRLRSRSAFLSDMVQWGDAARKRAITDDFTGLHNRRFLDDTLGDHVSRALAESQPISLLMCDLDHFHLINESHGQEVGDEINLAVVGVFRDRLRGTDIAVRYGGDEFVFILPGTTGEQARALGEAICSGAARLDVLKDRGGPLDRITTSIGVATVPDHANCPEGLRDAADAALYQAKESGRNRVAMAEKETTS